MRNDLIEELARRTNQPRMVEGVATITSLDPFEVRFDGEVLGAVNGMPWCCHIVGDQVRAARFGQQLVVYATLAQLPQTGVVSAYTANSANVTVVANDDTFTAQIVGSGWTPAVGDRVALIWVASAGATNRGALALKRGGPVANPPDPTPPPDLMNQTNGPDLPTPKPPTNTSGVATVLAQQTASYSGSGSLFTNGQGRYWLYNGTTEEGDSYYGYWFYGDRTQVVKGATITKFEIFLQRASGYGPTSAQTIPLELHDKKTRSSISPDGSVYSYDLIALKPGQSGWFTLPTDFGQRIANGQFFGVGVYADIQDLNALVGIDHPTSAQKNPQSGALRFTYKRSS